VWPISYQELSDIAVMWVDAALEIQEKDLRMMRRLIKAQSTQHSNYRYPNPVNAIEIAEQVAA
jgi:DSF synthase